MARTYLSGSNSRGNTVTASNSKDCHLRGWNAGVRVYASVDDLGRDVFRIYSTWGSTGGAYDKLLGTVTDTEHGPEWAPYYEVRSALS